MSTVSIIIPVYNVSSYLGQCLESVRAQTYQDIEVILIDDGSTDGSGAICDSYAKKDKRIKVVHKKNGGLSEARNVGLEIMRGEYLTFIDADDYVNVRYVETLMRCALRENLKLVIGSHIKFSDESKTFPDMFVEVKYQKNIYSRREVMLRMLYRKQIAMYAHGKVYHRSLFEELRFPKGKLFEDIPVTWENIKKIDKIAYMDMPLYYYRQRADSIVQSKYSGNKMAQVYFIKDIADEVREDIDLYQAALSHYFFSLIDIYVQVSRDYQTDKNFLEAEIKKYRRSILHNKRNDKKLRGLAALSYVSLGAVKRVSKLYKKIQQVNLCLAVTNIAD